MDSQNPRPVTLRRLTQREYDALSGRTQRIAEQVEALRLAAKLDREDKTRTKSKRMTTAKLSEQRKCAAVIRERRGLKRTPFPVRAAMLAEIKRKHPELADLTVRSQPFEKAWSANAPEAAKRAGKKPRA